MVMDDKPVPAPSAETTTFWDGCRAGELRYQRCTGCGRVQFYPRVLCAGCGGVDLAWQRSRGEGTVHAVTLVYRAPSAAFKADLPYAVALVDVDEGFRMMANIVGGDPAHVAIGDRVRVVFERRGDVMLPQFTAIMPSSPRSAVARPDPAAGPV